MEMPTINMVHVQVRTVEARDENSLITGMFSDGSTCLILLTNNDKLPLVNDEIKVDQINGFYFNNDYDLVLLNPIMELA